MACFVVTHTHTHTDTTDYQNPHRVVLHVHEACTYMYTLTHTHRPFKEKMNVLLKAMLKLEPMERMTFIEFFAAVDDIITSKIEIVSLLHGTSFKIMNDPNLT